MKSLSLERSYLCPRPSATEWRGTGTARFRGGIGHNGKRDLHAIGEMISLLAGDNFRGESEKAPNSMYEREVRNSIAVPI